MLLLESALIPLCSHHDEIYRGGWSDPKATQYQDDLTQFPSVVIEGSDIRFGKLHQEGHAVTWYGGSEHYSEDVSFRLSVTSRTIMGHYEVDAIVQRHPSLILQEKEWQKVKVIGTDKWLNGWRTPMVRRCGKHTESLLQLIVNAWEFHQKDTIIRELMIGDVKVKIKWKGDYTDSISLKRGYLPISFETALWDSAVSY